MRVVQFLQVVVLLLLLAYSVLVYLENPVLLRLPLLFAGRELVLPAGVALGLGLLTGALYAALLILPRYLRQRVLRRSDLLRRRDAETRLQATLQAVIDETGTAETAGPAQGQPDLSGPTDAEPAALQPTQNAAAAPSVQA
ncbi:hypothetical protein Q0M94_15595 [Deinococcus radiomollis]|uniref:hypothetical protein n=1 Tax=Deinococcus radiomollis TaxID=468916 RepID=UPI0038920F58